MFRNRLMSLDFKLKQNNNQKSTISENVDVENIQSGDDKIRHLCVCVCVCEFRSSDEHNMVFELTPVLTQLPESGEGKQSDSEKIYHHFAGISSRKIPFVYSGQPKAKGFDVLLKNVFITISRKIADGLESSYDLKNIMIPITT